MVSWSATSFLYSVHSVQKSTRSHLDDPKHYFRHLAQEYDLSNIRIPVHEWRDSANEFVHMRDYGQSIRYIQDPLVYNIVEGTAKAPVTRPSWIGSAVIESIQLFPEDEVDLRMLYIESAKNLKDEEDRKKEELHEAELERQRMIERERKRIADDNAYRESQIERKKQRLEEARRGFLKSDSTEAQMKEPLVHAGTSLLSNERNPSTSTQTLPNRAPVGARMSTGGKPPKKTAAKGKSARALEKEHAVEEGELVVEDVVVDEDINMDPNV
ncbi:hypothetical protein FB446DRAFT_702257 [Lentinula raphanica]|nr:hypothetical protein FB446DRAFT_702257 [Lentinula raphanica]